MTLDEWNQFKLKLIPGCTFLYTNSIYPEDQVIGQINPDGKTVNFKEEGWDKYWPILNVAGQRHYTKLSNFRWPNGSPMDTEYIPPTKQDLIIAKCQSLDLRFKNKTLPKCKTKSISFPDKKEITYNDFTTIARLTTTGPIISITRRTIVSNLSHYYILP